MDFSFQDESLISQLTLSSNLIEFEEYLKSSLNFRRFNPYSSLYYSICDLILKLMSLVFILTLIRVFSIPA